MKSWNELPWWKSEECASLHSRLKWTDYGKSKESWQPNQTAVYRALHETKFPDVKVVIVGQDPYPTPGMATGLCFSVPPDCPREKYPPSLQNIFKELCSDLHCPYPKTGDLTPWARRGVLLWNTVLTVEPGKPGSHRGWGWETLTKQVLSAVDEHHYGVVFILWGRDAQRNLPYILPSLEAKRNHVILSVHPSPLSANRGFFGSRPFSTANTLLKTNAIDWRL